MFIPYIFLVKALSGVEGRGESPASPNFRVILGTLSTTFSSFCIKIIYYDTMPIFEFITTENIFEEIYSIFYKGKKE